MSWDEEDGRPRAIALGAADNVRDLGGLPTRDGRRTRFGALLRGDLPDLLDDADRATLVDGLGLRTVVDLRTRGEVRHHAGAWLEHGVAWVHCPVHLAGFAPVPAPGADHVAGYAGFLDADPRALLLAIEVLSDERSWPALFHCAAGKDRTGVTAALLLDVLGVPATTIAEDYALTGVALERVLARLVRREPYRRTLAGARVAEHVPRAETMTRFLELVARRHGDAAGWMRAHGIGDATLERFRDAMLVPGPIATAAG